jgi:hypothetical protein
MEWSKKPSHATVPLTAPFVFSVESWDRCGGAAHVGAAWPQPPQRFALRHEAGNLLEVHEHSATPF